MNHQCGRKKLNLSSAHREAMLRNQVITLITAGHLVTTKARIKEVQRKAEKLVTLARVGNEMNARRRAKSLLPYSEVALKSLFTEIAPRYVQRPGGYTRVLSLGRRASDMALIARIEWV